jgi:hypothetical protein
MYLDMYNTSWGGGGILYLDVPGHVQHFMGWRRENVSRCTWTCTTLHGVEEGYFI